MSSIFLLLNNMRSRLAMYVGCKSLVRLAAFLRGYEHAIQPSDSRDPFLAEFAAWVRTHLKDSTHSWDNAILLRSDGDEAAVDAFWKLFDEFSAARAESIDTVRAPTPPNIAFHADATAPR